MGVSKDTARTIPARRAGLITCPHTDTDSNTILSRTPQPDTEPHTQNRDPPRTINANDLDLQNLAIQ